MALNNSLMFFFGASLLFVVAIASGPPDVCSTGKRQSPIDINTYEDVVNKTLQPLDRDYHFQKATLLTNGTFIEMTFVGKGELKIEGKAYNLTKLQFHTPSEHLLNGVEYPVELQQVHEAKDGSRAIVAILFKLGPSNPSIDMVMPQLQELAKKPCSGKEQKVDIPKFDLSFLRKWPREYYRYLGSLTSPPCDENVLWSVLCEAKTISEEQIAALTAPLCEESKKNARPVQPLNGRKVQTYDESFRVKKCWRCAKDLHPGMNCDGSMITCYFCNEDGHKSFSCPSLYNTATSTIGCIEIPNIIAGLIDEETTTEKRRRKSYANSVRCELHNVSRVSQLQLLNFFPILLWLFSE